MTPRETENVTANTVAQFTKVTPSKENHCWVIDESCFSEECRMCS